MKSLYQFQYKISQLIKGVGSYNEKTPHEKITINALALAGEAGEIANKIKKHIWYSPQEELSLQKDIGDELGDVMYHVAQLATELDLDLRDILRNCIDKVEKREVGNADRLSW